MKRWLALFTALMLLLPGCSSAPPPERAVTRFLDKLCKGDLRGAEGLTFDGTLNIAKTGRHASKIYKPLFGSIQYAVSGSVAEGDQAQVGVSVFVVDMEALMAEVSVEVIQHMLASGSKTGDELFYTLLLERLQSPDIPTITCSATAQLVKSDGKWKLDLSAPGGFSDAITGGRGELIGY